MDTLVQLLEMVLHIDKHLGVFIDQYGNWVYLFLFMIVFVETGLVLFPFLPGDSLLFIGGAFAATGAMDPWLLGVLLFIAAVTGNTLNYWIGSKIGTRVYEKNWRFLDRDALRKTHDFYEHHGGKTIVMARFVPVVRTFAPFVAGVSAMSWARFQLYNMLGALIWVVLLVGGGYLFGNLPIVKQYLNVIVLVGISAAVVPIALGAVWKLFTRGRRRVAQSQSK
ncbi:VTT domain-containing protein [Pandoraea bronchicola]|uniref:Membrane protein n=1 Tax=Pandoraea bronchicola TaxID=2508287 RepID=A0A5E5BT19_9BURK|nr:VTT domain-containing protein [Pandoraea bronchicola]VVE88548.1 membrane protein [Pandoraea bronchicola]